MISALLRAACVAPLVAIVVLGAPVAGHDDRPAPIERFVVFGDSLSDPGNAFVATGEFAVRPFEPIPSAPYLIGRFHFTNGRTWVEQLARDFDLFRSARPALLRPGVFTNYAIGGARARAAEPIDLATLIGLFLADFDGVAAPESLYVLWIGANDLRDAFAAFEQDPSGGTTEMIIQEALRATKRGIKDLYDAGARSFLVLKSAEHRRHAGAQGSRPAGAGAGATARRRLQWRAGGAPRAAGRPCGDRHRAVRCLRRPGRAGARPRLGRLAQCDGQLHHPRCDHRRDLPEPAPVSVLGLHPPDAAGARISERAGAGHPGNRVLHRGAVVSRRSADVAAGRLAVQANAARCR